MKKLNDKLFRQQWAHMPYATLLCAVFIIIIGELVCYYWKHLCSCVSDLLYLCMNSCICVKTSKQREKKVILYLGKDICHCYWINLSLKEERSPRHSLPFKTACHLAALVSVEEEGGGEESWEDEVDEGKKWLVSQLAADVAHCGKQEVSARFRAASAEHMDSCTVENHTNQRTHRNESHVTINEVQRVPKKG